MPSNTVVGIVVAVIAVLVVVGVALRVARRRSEALRHQRAEVLRKQLRDEDATVRHREAIAAEMNRDAIASSREELEQRRTPGIASNRF